MWSKRFWISVAERALKSFAYSLLMLWPLGDKALSLWNVDWKSALGGAGMTALLSVLGSIASKPIGPDDSPSLVGEPPKEPEALLDDEAEDPLGHRMAKTSDTGIVFAGGFNVTTSNLPPDPDDATPSGRHVFDDEPDDIPVSEFQAPRAANYRPGERN